MNQEVFAAVAAALTYALIRGAWASTETIALIAVTVVALVVFLVGLLSGNRTVG